MTKAHQDPRNEVDLSKVDIALSHWFRPVHGCYGFDGPCPRQGHLRIQGCAYHDESLNWRWLCDECQEATDEYWSEMWREYYSMVL